MGWLSSKGKGQFWGEFEVSHCNEWGLLRSCAEVRAAIELSFGTLSGVILGIHVLDGVVFSFSPIVSMAYFVTEMYWICAQKVDNISIWTIHRWNLRFTGFPKMYTNSRSMLGFESNWEKCNS